MKLGGIQKFSLMDYPDMVSCVVFTAGCNLRCPYCHNSSLIEMRDSGISENEFFEFLDSRSEMLDAVVVSGGEPTIHADLPDFLERIKDKGFLVKLDTNGTDSEMLESIIERGLVDYIAMDVKTSPERYGRVGGQKFEGEVVRSIDIVMEFENHEFRTTMAPGIVEEDDVKRISELVEGAERYYAQEFRSESVLDDEINLETGRMDAQTAIKQVKKSVKTCEVRES